MRFWFVFLETEKKEGEEGEGDGGGRGDRGGIRGDLECFCVRAFLSLLFVFAGFGVF